MKSDGRIGIWRAPTLGEAVEIVGVDAYGTLYEHPGPEVVGRAAGMIFAAGEAAMAADPFGHPDAFAIKNPDVEGVCKRITYRLTFIVSADDVTCGGPIHRQRAAAVAKVMYAALEARFGK